MKMRLNLFVAAIVLALICISDAYYGFRGSKVRSKGRDRERCPRSLPRPMDLDVFRRDVANDGYSLVLFMSSFPIDLETDVLYNFNIIFDNETSPNVFTQQFVGRVFGETTPGDCFSATNVFTAKTPDLAVFDSALKSFGRDFQISYFSSNARNYIIEVACNMTSDENFGRQCCTGAYFVAVCGTADPPHFLDWKAAMRDLWREMRIPFSDFLFLKRYLACDNAAP